MDSYLGIVAAPPATNLVFSDPVAWMFTRHAVTPDNTAAAAVICRRQRQRQAQRRQAQDEAVRVLQRRARVRADERLGLTAGSDFQRQRMAVRRRPL